MNEEVYFAFVHGIRLALIAHGRTIDQPDAIMPVIDRMQRICGSGKHSLVQFHDSIPHNDAQSYRDLERELCQRYLRDVEIVNA